VGQVVGVGAYLGGVEGVGHFADLCVDAKRPKSGVGVRFVDDGYVLGNTEVEDAALRVS